MALSETGRIMSAYFPWYCQSPEMRTNLLVMCKMLFLLLVFNGFYGYISDPFIPHIPILDDFNEVPGLFEWSLKSLFLIGGIGLMCNVRVRVMAFLLGVCVLLFLLASKPAFRNHIVICGCIFLLCSLMKKEEYPWLLIYQFSLVYFAAALNKIWQADWWNGHFIHNMLLNAFGNPYYEWAHEIFPERLLARLISWGSIATELGISFMLLFKKWHRTAFWTILIFHAGMFTATAFRFGHFFEDALIYLLAFSAWPEKDIDISIDPEKEKRSRRVLTFLNWNRQFRIRVASLDAGNWLQIKLSGKDQTNSRALGSLLLYTPATFFLLLFFDSAAQFSLNWLLDPRPARVGLYGLTLVWLWGGIFFYGYLKVSSFAERAKHHSRRRPTPVE